MTLFGEIIIPSSRALWDEEFEENHQTIDTISFNWNNDSALPSKKIETLLVIESSKLATLARTCLLNNHDPVCKIEEAKIFVYKIKNNEYMVVFEENGVATSGEVVEKLIPWIQNSNKIVAFNSLPAVTYQSNSSEEKPSCFIRSLCTSGASSVYASRLEAPNLATGLTAGVLSYCQHIGIEASLYICYLEPRPLDSLSAQPIMDLFKKLNIPIIQPFKGKTVINDSFLYM